MFSLLETMRLENGRIVRRARHLARMAGSAAHFSYPWSGPGVNAALDACARTRPDGVWRVRLLVAADGTPTIECTPHRQGDGVWRVALAGAPIDPADPFILNKTTQRAVYEAARAVRPDVDDVLLWNIRGEITESTIGNVVAEIDGMRCTPTLTSGLLAGTFRAELLDSGAVRERVLTAVDLAAASRLWLINSVREWVDAELVT